MKKLFAVAIAIILLSFSCAALANQTITIGATYPPHGDILEFIKEDYAALGYDLNIIPVSDYFISNPATTAGDMDANYFQHVPFLTDYNNSVEEAERLVPAIAVHCEPYGIYPGTKASLDQIAKGDKIAVTNDPSNETRALLLLQDAGLIKLPEGSDFTSTGLTKESIVENPYELDIYEVNAELITGMLEDVAFAVINGNYAISAGLSIKDDALFTEADGVTGQAYSNYVVCRAEDVDSDWIKALESLLHTQKVIDFILTNEDFGGGVVPAFTLAAE